MTDRPSLTLVDLAMPTVVPFVHREGTPKGELLRNMGELMCALNHAYMALARVSPHPRDYYRLNNGAHAEAMKEHTDNRNEVARLMAHYRHMYDAIAAQ